MRHTLPLLVATASLAMGCPKQRLNGTPPEAPPAWASERGRNQTRLELAQVLVEGDNPEAALSLMRQLQAEGIDSPELDVLRAEAFRKVGLTDDAEDLLREVVRKHGGNSEAHNQLGILLLDRHRTEEAIEHFDKAFSTDDNNAEYANNLGFAYMSAGRPDDAITALKAALNLDATRALTRNNLGFALVAAGRDDQAYRVFRVGSTESQARYNLGVGLELRGELDAAAEQYALAMAADPSDGNASSGLARVSAPQPDPTPPPLPSPPPPSSEESP